MKIRRKLLSITGLAIVATPTIGAISCGSKNDSTSNGITFQDSDYITAQQTASYADGVGKLLSGDIDFAGGYLDIRTTVDNSDRFTNGKIVGMTKYRIANDGIQVRGNMKAGDQYVIQQLFRKLIKDAAQNPDLQITISGASKSLFNVYSHSDYVPLSSGNEIGYMDSGVIKKKKAISSTAPANSGQTEIFQNTNGAINDTDYTNFATKSGKTLSVQFIPSNDPTLAQAASVKLQAFLISKGISANVTTSSEYSVTATALQNNTLDLGFLPVNSWATLAASSNFILQAARPALVSTMSISGTTASVPSTNILDQKTAVLAGNDFGQLQVQQLPATIAGLTADWATSDTTGRRTNFLTAYNTSTNPLHNFAKAVMNYRVANTDITDATKYLAGAYEAAIYSKNGNKFGDKVYNELMTNGNNFTLSASDLVDGSTKAKYGFTSLTSSASYVFPELWFNTHFVK